MTGVRITGLAAERPRRRMTNDELPAELRTTDEWVRARTGIATRGVAGDGESVVDLATAAAAKAIADAGIDPGSVDLLLLATCSLPTPVPAGAPEVAARLGLRAGALDLNAACAGFCSALAVAADAVRAGSARHAVVIGAERMTDWLDWHDRGTAILFGDGAGAVVVSSVADGQDGIGPVVWGSDGGGRDLIHVPDFGRHLAMEGSAVFRWATTRIAEVGRAACARAGIEVSELAAFVPHQANLRIVSALARQLDLPDTVVVSEDVVDAGNTSGASVPMALGRLREEGRISSGDPVLLLAFGAGLAWAAQVVRCP